VYVQSKDGLRMQWMRVGTDGRGVRKHNDTGWTIDVETFLKCFFRKGLKTCF